MRTVRLNISRVLVSYLIQLLHNLLCVCLRQSEPERHLRRIRNRYKDFKSSSSESSESIAVLIDDGGGGVTEPPPDAFCGDGGAGGGDGGARTPSPTSTVTRNRMSVSHCTGVPSSLRAASSSFSATAHDCTQTKTKVSQKKNSFTVFLNLVNYVLRVAYRIRRDSIDGLQRRVRLWRQ
jgi:hypothetical protein